MADTTKGGIGSVVVNKLMYLILIILLHLGCFMFTTKDKSQTRNNWKRKLSPSAVAAAATSKSSQSTFKSSKKALSATWSYLKRIVTVRKMNPSDPPASTLTSARSSHRSLVALITPEPDESIALVHPTRATDGHNKVLTASFELSESDISNGQHFPLRNDIFPCTTCGEIFHNANHLDNHKSIKHSVTELVGCESGKNIVQIIFNTGWSSKDKTPNIQRILKIHNSPKIVSRFEEYRELVRAKAAAASVSCGKKRTDHERCIADGNELLRFYCSTFTCDLGLNGNSSLCNNIYCSICNIIKSGFSPKMDGISTLATSWRAHVAVPDGIEEEFGFMNVRRAMLVCRVVAGRVGSDFDLDLIGEEPEGADSGSKEDGGFDSVVGGSGGCGTHMGRLDDGELLVFNPRAVLPCFVIVYNTV